MATSKPKLVKSVKSVKPEEVTEKIVEKVVPEKVEKVEEKVVEAAPLVISNVLPELKEMLEAGVHFGHSVKRRNPKMDEYVYAVKNGVQIFDLVKTRAQLVIACDYLAEVTAKGGKVLLVGTKGQAAPAIRAEADRLGMPFITTRWVGGLFTNWDQLRTRINRLIDMKSKFASGEYKKYTKKEQVVLKKEMDRLERMYGGLVSMTELPQAIFIVDPTSEATALRESLLKQIPVVAVCDSNCNPTGITHVIPANDDALKSVVMLIGAVTGAIEKGQKNPKKS